mgnify:CR=1 FL=1
MERQRESVLLEVDNKIEIEREGGTAKLPKLYVGNGNELVRLERLRHVGHHEKYCICGISWALSADFGFCSKFGRETETYMTLHIKAKFGKLEKN